MVLFVLALKVKQLLQKRINNFSFGHQLLVDFWLIQIEKMKISIVSFLIFPSQ